MKGVDRYVIAFGTALPFALVMLTVLAVAARVTGG